MAPYEPCNPSVTHHTHQPHWTLKTPKDPYGPPHDCFKTSEYPLSSPGTHQNPSGPFEPLMIPNYDFINLLKDKFFCRKMLVFYLNAFYSLINIEVGQKQQT